MCRRLSGSWPVPPVLVIPDPVGSICATLQVWAPGVVRLGPGPSSNSSLHSCIGFAEDRIQMFGPDMNPAQCEPRRQHPAVPVGLKHRTVRRSTTQWFNLARFDRRRRANPRAIRPGASHEIISNLNNRLSRVRPGMLRFCPVGLPPLLSSVVAPQWSLIICRDPLPMKKGKEV